MPNNPTQVSEADYIEATESYTGFCTNCKEFTTDHVEPDAEHYKCDECGSNTVVGAEQALILGLITFE